MNPPTLTGAGVVLRPLSPHRDAEAIHAVMGDAVQMRYELAPHTGSVMETRSALIGWMSDYSPQWAITLDGGEALGRVTLIHQRERIMEIGIQVVPAHQGRGLARRSIAAATQYAFDVRDCVRVFADIDPRNAPCLAAFTRAGYRHEGTLVANWVTDRGVLDSAILAATAGWTAP